MISIPLVRRMWLLNADSGIRSLLLGAQRHNRIDRSGFSRWNDAGNQRAEPKRDLCHETWNRIADSSRSAGFARREKLSILSSGKNLRMIVVLRACRRSRSLCCAKRDSTQNRDHREQGPPQKSGMPLGERTCIRARSIGGVKLLRPCRSFRGI
jgi:hypothetical protein